MLLDIDEEAFLQLGETAIFMQVVIVGGAAFMLCDLTNRTVTHDIDVFQAEGAVSDILFKYPQVNGGVAAFSDQIPYGFEDRLKSLNLGTKVIKYMTPSIEDLVVMKLYSMRPNDIQDIDSAADKGLIDWDLLEKLVYDKDEARASILSERRYAEMTKAYEDFKKRKKNEYHI